MKSLERVDEQLGALLRAETSDYVEAINQALLGLESRERSRDDALGEVLRAAHSLKGAAAASGLTRVETLVHNWESCAHAIMRAGELPTGEQFDLLYRALDAIDGEIQAACTGHSPTLACAPPTVQDLSVLFGVELEPVESLLPVAPDNEGQDGARPFVRVHPDQGGTLRVATAKVDALMTKVEALVQARAGGAQVVERSEQVMEAALENVRGLEQLSKLLASEGRGTRTDTRSMAESLGELRRRVHELSRGSEALYLELRRHRARLEQVTAGLRDDVRSVRMVPVGEAFQGLPRLVRDASHKLSRQVTLEVRGADIEVDRDLVDTVKDAVMHLVRNAIAHGIETPEDRLREGKASQGKVTVQASSAAGGMQVTVSDDGRGIDTKKVAARAVSAGLVTASDAAAMTREHIEELVFCAGLSTSDDVDEISGRGVGLDAVRALVERAGGAVSLRSELGRGTEFMLRMPLNLTTMRMLLVRLGSTRMAFASSMVARIARVGHDEVRTVDGGQAIEVDGRVYPVAHLAELLGMPAPGERKQRMPAVLVASGNERAALLVDSVDGELELILKPLGDHLGRVEAMAGVTVMPDGEIVPLVQVSHVVKRARSLGAKAPLFAHPDEGKSMVRRILVVDDSITTRTLEKSILEASGYHVETATDGVDALGKLALGRFDLVISDVQMPRMDGIELTRRIKASAAHRALSVVLVSSLNEESDRKKGLEAGASAYLSKQEFRQDRLLTTLEKLP